MNAVEVFDQREKNAEQRVQIGAEDNTSSVLNTCNRTASFAVHIEAIGSAFRVYLKRHTPAGIAFAMHRARGFDDPAQAEFYANELAETHGGLAVVHH